MTTKQSNNSPAVPLVSVMMNCLNGEKYLKEAINSVYAQTYPNWEIVFWDNASSDTSGAIANSYDSRLKYFRGDKTILLGPARNKALEHCEGDYIAILDCDDVWLPQKLEKQMTLFHKNPRIAVVYSNCQTIDSNGCSFGKNKKKFYRGMIFDDMLRNNFIPPSPTVVMKKEYIHSVGSFLEYKASLDLDMLLKLAFRYPFDYVGETLAMYRIHEQTVSFDYEAAYLECCEILNYWKKHPGCQTPLRSGLINHAIARCYYIIGVYSLIQDHKSKKARSNLVRSWRIAPSLKVLIFFCLSFMNPLWIGQMMLWIRKNLGRGIIPR